MKDPEELQAGTKLNEVWEALSELHHSYWEYGDMDERVLDDLKALMEAYSVLLD